MNYLKQYADQVATISNDMKAGNISMEEGAEKLLVVAERAEQSSVLVTGAVYSDLLNEMAAKIYAVVDKMIPEHRIIQ
ncbi:hypothetical protein [Maridesulfovibrio frigidus]|uniref:hypothetical protein n=1 Tax=Maridesulfovibrio frigidus TaxID=340956 RepID=UPI0004E22D0E|nr:hypothetical protein [Maridesulfovibrio frigidus]